MSLIFILLQECSVLKKSFFFFNDDVTKSAQKSLGKEGVHMCMHVMHLIIGDKKRIINCLVLSICKNRHNSILGKSHFR